MQEHRERGLHGAPVRQRLRAGRRVSHPSHRDPVELVLAAPALVARRDDTHLDPAAHQPARERGEERARNVTRPPWIVVGEEATRTGQSRTSSLSRRARVRAISRVLLLEPGDHLAEEAEPEQDDAADDHGLDQVQQRPEPEAVAEAEHQRGDAGRGDR